MPLVNDSPRILRHQRGIGPDTWYNETYAALEGRVSRTDGAASIAAISWNAGTVSVTTAAPHHYTAGQRAVVANNSPTAFNGIYAVTVTGPTRFTYSLASDPGADVILGTTYPTTSAPNGTMSPLQTALPGINQGNLASVPVLSCEHGCWVESGTASNPDQRNAAGDGTFNAPNGIFDAGTRITPVFIARKSHRADGTYAPDAGTDVIDVTCVGGGGAGGGAATTGAAQAAIGSGGTSGGAARRRIASKVSAGSRSRSGRPAPVHQVRTAAMAGQPLSAPC